MKNALGNDIVWKWEMNKINPPLAVSLQEQAMRQSADMFQYPINASSYWYDNGDIYFDEEEVRMVECFIDDNISKDASYPDRMSRRLYELSNQVHLHPAVAHSDTLVSLLEMFTVAREPIIALMSALAERGPMPMANVLRRRVESIIMTRAASRGMINQVGDFIQAVSLAIRPSVFAEEQRALCEASVGFTSLGIEQQMERAEAHRTRFAWMNFHWGVGTPRTTDDVMREMKKSANKASVEYERLLVENDADESACEHIMNILDVSSAERDIIRRYREYLYLRTFVKDSINVGFYNVLPLFEMIARKKGIEPFMMPFLTVEEIDGIADADVERMQSVTASRRQEFSAGIVEGVFVVAPFQKQDEQRMVNNDSHMVRGTTAYRGIVSGTARILVSPAEQDRVHENDILIVGMTTPDYLSAMKRAAAFVTDEGGITCHAAIIAREMKKPCVIGTKIATRVLKDGDVVEVDADNGVVRVLS